MTVAQGLTKTAEESKKAVDTKTEAKEAPHKVGFTLSAKDEKIINHRYYHTIKELKEKY